MTDTQDSAQVRPGAPLKYPYDTIFLTDYYYYGDGGHAGFLTPISGTPVDHLFEWSRICIELVVSLKEEGEPELEVLTLHARTAEHGAFRGLVRHPKSYQAHPVTTWEVRESFIMVPADWPVVPVASLPALEVLVALGKAWSALAHRELKLRDDMAALLKL